MEKQIQKIRAFNRTYTKVIGLLDRYLLHSQYTLPEVRVLYEIRSRSGITSKQLVELLEMDKGYLSRMLRRFEKLGLVHKEVDAEDQRSMRLRLTRYGHSQMTALNKASDQQIEKLLSALSATDRRSLIMHMDALEVLLNKLKGVA